MVRERRCDYDRAVSMRLKCSCCGRLEKHGCFVCDGCIKKIRSVKELIDSVGSK